MNLPSEKVLQQKKAIVSELTEKLKSACAGVIVDYKGINVADDTNFQPFPVESADGLPHIGPGDILHPDGIVHPGQLLRHRHQKLLAELEIF